MQYYISAYISLHQVLRVYMNYAHAVPIHTQYLMKANISRNVVLRVLCFALY